MIRLLVGMNGAKTETLAVVHDFKFFTGTSKASETFCTIFLYFFIFPKKIQNFWSTRSMVNVQITTDCPV